MSEDLNIKTGRAVKWSSLTEIMSKLIPPIVNIILARLLTPEAFGAVATITMIITFAEVFSDAGFQKYIIQHEFESSEELDRGTNVSFWTNFVLSSVTAAVIILFRHKLALLVGSLELGNAIAVASLIIVLVSFSSIQTARFKRDFDFKSLFFVRIGASVIPLVVTVPLALILRNYWALLAGTIAVHLFNAVVLTVKSKWKPGLFYSFKMLKDMFSFTVWTWLESILIWLTSYIDIFIVGRALSDYYLGVYQTSMSTIGSYMGIVSSAIIPVLFSALSRNQGDSEAFKSTYWKFFKYTSVLVIPMSVGVFIYSDLVTNILLGSQWSEAAGFIGLWGLMSGLTIVFSHLASEVFRSMGNPRLSMFTQVVHLLFLIPAVLIGVNYSFSTLYTLRSLVRVQSIVTSSLFLCAIYKFKFSKMVKNIIPSLISTVIMAIAGMIFVSIWDGIVLQLISIVLCVIIYFTALLLLFPGMREEIFDLPIVKKIIKR